MKTRRQLLASLLAVPALSVIKAESSGFLPCSNPACAGQNSVIIRCHSRYGAGIKTATDCYVYCLSCSYFGRPETSIDAAIKSWNRQVSWPYIGPKNISGGRG